VIVLHESLAHPELLQPSLMIAFEKKAARVLVHLGTNQQDAGNGGLSYLQAAPA
jgi:hypothetical protein